MRHRILLLLAAAACLSTGACGSRESAPRTRVSPEAWFAAEFVKERPGLVRVELDLDEPACRWAAAAAFKLGGETVMIEYSLGQSNRWWVLDFHYERGELRRVVQRSWFLLDDQAEELDTPRPESETRFQFSGGRLTAVTGDAPPAETDAKELLNESQRLLGLPKLR